MSEFFNQIICERCGDYSVIIEDDGNVCYAYLYFRLAIIADVWLYNQANTPLNTEWKKEKMPFLNPIEFVKEEEIMRPIVKKDEIQIEFSLFEVDCSVRQVKISIRGKLVAILEPGSKPGWSKRVKKDGPLAKIFGDEKLD